MARSCLTLDIRLAQLDSAVACDFAVACCCSFAVAVAVAVAVVMRLEFWTVLDAIFPLHR